MKKYQAYKDSGIEWIGEIPEHWSVLKYKRLFSVSSGDFLISEEKAIDENNGFPVYGGNGLRGYSKNHNYEGQLILIGRVGAKCGNIHLVDGKYWVSEHALRVKKKVNYDDFYMRYLLELTNFNQFAITTAQPLLNSEIVLDRKSILPPIEEQKIIASFLDQKTSEIENLIKKKNQLIALLKEERTAIINNAVTKGINPNVKLKESGVEWIGEIPEHWVVTRLANFGKFLKGRGISKADLTELGVSVILYGDIYTKYNLKTDEVIRKTSPETAENSIRIYEYDLLFTASGETKEDIGKCICYLGNEEVFAGGDVVILRQNINESLYLSYIFNSYNIIAQKARLSKGEIVVHIYASQLRNIAFGLPHRKEQREILDYLEKKTFELDTIISKAEKEIELMKEYKTALISEVVTGKIDVREEILS